jgi:hypothetical protein
MSCDNKIFLLLEDGGFLLLETDGEIILEDQIPVLQFAPILPGAVEFDSVGSENLSELSFYKSGKQFFTWPGYSGSRRIAQPTVGTADGFGLLGFWEMPNQLLVVPGAGRLSGEIYTVYASGYMVIPDSFLSPTVNLLLEQNYFSNPDPDGTVNSIVVQRDAVASVGTAISLTPGSVIPWSLVCRLQGARKNGIISGSYNITVDCVSYTGVLSSNRNPRIEPIIQLSLGVDFSGQNIGSDDFKARMTQFILRRGVR